jgi:hypothetical protein
MVFLRHGTKTNEEAQEDAASPKMMSRIFGPRSNVFSICKHYKEDVPWSPEAAPGSARQR